MLLDYQGRGPFYVINESPFKYFISFILFECQDSRQLSTSTEFYTHMYSYANIRLRKGPSKTLLILTYILS